MTKIVEGIYRDVRLEQDIKTRTKVFGYFKTGDDISVSRIQRYCTAGYNSASRVLENLIADGLIKQKKGCIHTML